MELVMFFGALLMLGVARGSLLPSAVPGSEIEAGLGHLLMRRDCHANNCARAVTGTNARTALTARQSDCSSFMRQTVLFPTTTITATANHQRRQQTVIPSNIPVYASACENASNYSSACSCWGITATTVTVRPTATLTSRTLTGVFQVKNTAGGTLGYVATDPNYWTPDIESDVASALVVTFEVPVGATSASGVEFVINSNNPYPFLGLVQGRDSTGSVEQPGSYNYLYLDPTAHTAPGSTPQVVGSYFDSMSGLSHTAESSVWNINLGTGVVTPTWTNPDGNPASDVQLFIQSNHLYAGSDPNAFHTRFPAPVTIGITFTFIPSS